MKWPRFRFTVRRALIAVAIFAFAFKGVMWVAEMRARSAEYYGLSVKFIGEMRCIGSIVETEDGRRVDRYEDENTRLHDDWATELARKYRRLSDYPWMFVEPDPPHPKVLEHPRSAFDLPDRDTSSLEGGSYPFPETYATRPPWWTFLWTWGR